MKIDFDKGMPPRKVAAGILRALRKNRNGDRLGWDARWMLRVNRFLPRLVDACWRDGAAAVCGKVIGGVGFV